ncbi:two-component system NarL family sensor kinase [Chitinivorax tropicus]|uniref:Two-component system NarL family sensor kinase n=2 Tax=Chitinivorax tropicus TaxID=714531 RepID=A0A840MHI8_9PROT|nr:two-component system NarL family sensor kinase [Chitinivorax tropicus]
MHATYMTMNLKHKIFALTILPLLLALAVIALLVWQRAEDIADQQAKTIEEALLTSKRAELKHYVSLALSAIEPHYQHGLADANAQARAKAALRALSFDSDGYFFVYDLTGTNLVHPRQPDLEGRNLWDMQDRQGRYVIRALVEAAKAGGGYPRYGWEKPSTGQLTEKLGHVVLLDRWGWVVGTGIYLDDVAQAIAEARKRAGDNARNTLYSLGGIALVAVLIVFGAGLALNVSEQRLADDKLKTLAQRIVTLQEEERARVARDLHDGISQVLVSTKFQFELAQYKVEHGGVGAADDLRKGIDDLSSAIHEVRRISHDLRSSILDTLGLSAAIAQLANEFELRNWVAVNFDNQLGDFELPDHEAIALFRIAQEALTNTERHAEASEVQIKLVKEPRQVRLAITDNGQGFDATRIDRDGGIGLRNIRERVEHLGGQFHMTSAPGCTRLEVCLPLSLEAHT